MKTCAEFNEKYKEYLEEGYYGCSIGDNEKALDYLDKVFQGLILKEGFKYHQIKTKFNSIRFYANSPDILNREIEQNIKNILDNDNKE